MFFVLCLLLFSEFNTTNSQAREIVLFKGGSPATLDDDSEKAKNDEEKGNSNGISRTRSPTILEEVVYADEKNKAEESDRDALKAVLKMTDIFSWQHLNYTVPTSTGQRQLLNDVSGFVAPGKLTALMGESGAGKVR